MQADNTFGILVIDDEPPICDILERVAQKTFPEARFTNTRSAQETIDYLDNQSSNFPKLVLLDIDLHQSRNGLDLLPELRSRFQGKVPIIMLSVLAEDHKVEQAYDQGAVAYTRKPEDMQGWQHYVLMLKNYWYQSAKLPRNDS